MKHKLHFALQAIMLMVSLLSLPLLLSCGRQEAQSSASSRSPLQQVLYVQSLYNNRPGQDIVPQITAVIDSMKAAGRNPYYFAATNILIDRLFSDGRFAEADSLAVRMEEEANADRDSTSLAMAKRVRAQMYYKLSQPSRALSELEPAGDFITHPYRSDSEFGTATSIQEWLWIIARELGDTTLMNRAGLRYAMLVEESERINNWVDSSGHYPVTALSFKAEDSFSKGNVRLARELLDSASSKVLPTLPSRAYEHLYEVRCKMRAHDSDWKGAIADADTLLKTHRDFPWFYLRDLLLKAEVLNMAGMHEESAKAYSDYICFHDSLSGRITDKRLHDLTVLYRTELDHEQRRAELFRLFAFGAVILLLLILLAIAVIHAANEKKRVRHLVEQLEKLDRNAVTESAMEEEEEEDDTSPINRLDRHMRVDRPYTDPSLSRKELAEFAGISQDALGQLIKNEKGISVRTYINSFRLEEARKLLGSDSDEGIAEMAVRLGFGTARTLQRAFRERYEMSPTQYREASKELNHSTEN